MNVAIVRPSDVPHPAVDVCIVVDVLRATTTATVLCHRLGQVCLVRTPDDLSQLPARPAGYALFSELRGLVSEIPRFDNSPIQARDAELAGRMPVLVTTNGTIAVGLAAMFAAEVLLASFVNLSAVVDYVRARGVATVAVMPAGNVKKAKRCIEDDGCADALVARLSADASFDVRAVIAACRLDARIVERRANEPNLGADIDLCFEVDAVPVVPRVADAAAQRWFDVTATRL